ncbi:MAG TPA: tetratricopeptide repeat protein [Longimicrobiaceae bacterium]|jgi:hypothetical protein|nr:tetratricopeptide repeat protein [Longimicrobiaceae bacterium]
MSTDRESTLRPLRAAEQELWALRGGDEGARARAVVRLAGAVETTLRRLLRDDPTAPVDLRLRALSPDDLPAEAMLAELRQRDRLPMELAAGFYEMMAGANRIAAGGAATQRDADVALSVAEGLERHVTAHPLPTAMQDPVFTPADQTLIPPSAEEEAVHAVPTSASRGRPWGLIATAAVLAALLVGAAVWLTRGRSGTAELARGESLFRQGQVNEAERTFMAYSVAHPDDATPHLYLSQIYRRSGRRADSAREIKAGLQAAPDDPRLRTELGFLLLDSGHPAQAVPHFRTAIAADPQSTLGWGGLVRALRAAGQPAAAERALAGAPPQVRAMIPAAPLPAAPAYPADGTVPAGGPGAPAGAQPPAVTVP